MDIVRKKKVKTGHRLFVCLMPNKEVRDQVRDIQRSISRFSFKLNFVNLEQVHLTLKFLGDNISNDSVDLIKYELIKLAQNSAPVKITTQEPEFGFPGQTKASTVHLTIEPNKQIIELSRNIHYAVKAIGLEDVSRKKDTSKFLGHFTIARVRRDISRSIIRNVREILKQQQIEPKTFTADSIYLIESRLTKKGPIYSIFANIPLNKNIIQQDQ